MGGKSELNGMWRSAVGVTEGDGVTEDDRVMEDDGVTEGDDGVQRSAEEYDRVWRNATECDGGWRRVTEGDGGWRRVTENDGEWRRVTEYDGEWRSCQRDAASTLMLRPRLTNQLSVISEVGEDLENENEVERSGIGTVRMYLSWLQTADLPWGKQTYIGSTRK